jgi:hypothetical protein
MRIKNKEIRQRRHRKDQKIKDAARELRAKYGDKPTATPAAEKSAAKPKAAAPKKPAAAAAKKPAAKKTEAAAE